MLRLSLQPLTNELFTQRMQTPNARLAISMLQVLEHRPSTHSLLLTAPWPLLLHIQRHQWRSESIPNKSMKLSMESLHPAVLSTTGGMGWAAKLGRWNFQEEAKTIPSCHEMDPLWAILRSTRFRHPVYSWKQIFSPPSKPWTEKSQSSHRQSEGHVPSAV